MKFMTIEGATCLLSEFKGFYEDFKGEEVDLSQYKSVGNRVLKSQEKKAIHAPVDMAKLLKLTEECEYHAGCIEAYRTAVIMQVKSENSDIKTWLKTIQLPAGVNPVSLLQEFVANYQACGNGFLLKIRDASDNWVGLKRLNPHEIQIVEAYDTDTNLLAPDYIEFRNNKKTLHKNLDVIHLKKATYKSEAWGVSSEPVIPNITTLKEIKKLDLNNFKNGLMADYIIFLKGGSLDDEKEIRDKEGNIVATKTYRELIADAFRAAKGNVNSHGSIIIELDMQAGVEIHPLRNQSKEGDYLALKKDLREGAFAYHRVPPRMVSQLVAGQLGGGSEVLQEMKMFYNTVAKPIQNAVAWLLASEFNKEFDCSVEAENAFDFGNISDLFIPEITQFDNEMEGRI